MIEWQNVKMILSGPENRPVRVVTGSDCEKEILVRLSFPFLSLYCLYCCFLVLCKSKTGFFVIGGCVVFIASCSC